ncbi:hypothetical protein [Mucilaginibacter antarcticus]|uniref:TonB-like protein n=1 Tax=Mucilaginibacter antarcticus TaxID=1855725 RepID=A0ABW5XTA2_9SPHI
MKNLTNALIAVLCLFNLHAHAQQYDAPIYEFYGSVTKALPVSYKPVAVMIKIDVDHAGKVADITLSDSAQPDFRRQFEAAKKAFNMEALNRYINLNKLKHTSFLIPYYVTNANNKSKPQTDPLLTKFKGKEFKGKVRVLRPISSTYAITTTTTKAL